MSLLQRAAPLPALSDDALDALAAIPRRQWVAFTGLTLLLLALGVVAIAVGSVTIPLGDVIRILAGGEGAHGSWETIVEQIRVPRTITAVLAGAALGVAGLQMQTIFRNPLADPFVLGVSAGASLGVAVVILLAGTTGSVFVAGLGFLGSLGLAGAATLGAAAVLVIVLIAASQVRSMVTILIVGLMVGQAVGALVVVLLALADATRVQQFVLWGFGSFRGVTWQDLQVMVPAIGAGLAVGLATAKPLNAMLLGEGYARSLGVPILRMRIATLGGAALLAGVVTAFAGPIVFLGVAIPHLARGVLGTSDHRILIPGVILLGGIVALAAEIIAQLPGSAAVLPLNAVTALLGAPVVILVLVRNRRGTEAMAS